MAVQPPLLCSASDRVCGTVLGTLFRPQHAKPRLLCALRRLPEREPGVSVPQSYRADNGRMERLQAAATSASTASTVQLHALFGQGKKGKVRNFELFEICSFSCIPFLRAKCIVPLSTLMESIWAAAGSLAVHSICFRLRAEFRLVAPYVCF
jgi:hypothetical protein